MTIEEKIIKIVTELATRDMSQVQLAKSMGLNQSDVSKLISRKYINNGLDRIIKHLESKH